MSTLKHKLYKTLPSAQIPFSQGHRVAVVGKVVEINAQNEYLMLETDPIRKLTFRVTIHPYEFQYLFIEKQIQSIADKINLAFLNQIINPRKYTQARDYKLGGQVTLEKQINECEIGRQVGDEEYNRGNLRSKRKSSTDKNQNKLKSEEAIESTKHIRADSFQLNQYLEVRAKVISAQQLLLFEFTSFGFGYDLLSHNYALSVAFKQCQQLFC